MGKTFDEICKIQVPGKFYDYLHFFSQSAPIDQAIGATLRLCRIQKEMLQAIGKKAAYPILLLLMAYLLIFFFLSFIFPQMQQITDSTTPSVSIIVLSAMKYVFTALLILLLVLAGLIVFLHGNVEARAAFLLRFHTRIYFFDHLCAYLFAAFLYELSRQGIATKQAFLLLRRLEQKSLLYPCICELQALLEKGYSYPAVIETCTYFSQAFQRFFKIGYLSGSLEQLLSVFLKQEIELWQKKLQKGGVLLQLIVYGVIALLVFSVYQMMLMPLELLNQM